MSLEQALKDNTETMKQLIAVLTNTTVARANVEAANSDLPVEVPAKATPTPKKKAAAPKAVETPKAETQPEQTVPAGDTSVTYDDVKTKTLALVKYRGRDAATALLAQFKVEKAPDLKPEQWEKYVAEADKQLKGVEKQAA